MTRSGKIFIGGGIALFLCVILYLFLLLFISSETRSTSTQPQSPGRPEVTLRCDECEDAGMDINLWNSPDDRRIVGSVPNRTRATVLDQRTDDSGLLHYKVTAGNVTGWVSEHMVQQ